MIKGINISRALVSPSGTKPSQWSNNGQLCINNGNQLTILDPKLPNFYKAVISQTEYNEQGDYQNTLCSEELFDQTVVLQVETLRQMDVCNFNRVKMTSSSDLFYFTRIIEPQIVKHLWSCSPKTTKDCSLGVLLNTGELLVMKRTNKSLQQYQPSFCFFKIIADELGLLPTAGDELEVDEQQFKKLKIRDFEFVTLNGVELVMVLNEAEELKIYSGEELLQTIVLPHASKFTTLVHDNQVSIAFTTDRNELTIYRRHDSSFTVVLKPSRFKLSQLVWHQQLKALIAIDSNSVHVYHNKALKSVKLSGGNVASLVPFDEEMIIAYEHGSFDKLSLNLMKSEPFHYLNDHFNTISLDFQVANALNNTTNNDASRLLVQSATINSISGILSVTYKFIADKHISYKILSKNDYYVEFVSLEGLSPSTDSVTSLAAINSLWFNQFHQLLAFPKNFQIISSLGFVSQFKAKLIEFKETHLGKVSKLSYNGDIKPIAESLVEGFVNNGQVSKHQKLYNMNIIISNCVNNLISKLETFDLPPEIVNELTEYMKSLEHEQETIKKVLRLYLFNIMSHSSIGELSDIDKYVLMSYHIASKADGYKVAPLPFEPNEVSITIKTEYVTESFSVSVDEDFTELAISKTNHGWPRCGLTLLPLLEEENRIDELNQFNYIINNDFGGLTEDLISTLDYCIFTGNKVYRTG